MQTIANYRYKGLWVAAAVITAWIAMLVFNFLTPAPLDSVWTWLRVLVQAHLFTGLFITAHDAMHGTVAPKNPKLNHAIGWVCATLFVFNSYKKLLPKHHEHHRHVGTHDDPDFHRGESENFFLWYFDFLRTYVTWWQILLAAITFNVLKLWLPEVNLILFWIVPSLLSTLQLFYFGTYLPHRGEHAPDNPHHSRTQGKNHLWAFLSCYFFGYHYEHHDSPATPWWRLWKVKEMG